MKVIMFAGADAMTDLSASLSALAVPEVQQLLQEYNLFENLAEHFANMYTVPYPALAASVLTQVGLFRSHTRQFGNKFSLVGCSMGDLAKLICANVIDIETALEGIEKFADGLKDVEPGSLLHIKTEGLREKAFFEELNFYDLHLAMDQTQNDCLIAGRVADLKLWKTQSEAAQNAKVELILPYPLHSPLMEPAYKNLEYIFLQKTFRSP